MAEMMMGSGGEAAGSKPKGLLARAAGQMAQGGGQQGGPMPGAGAEPANDADDGTPATPERQALYERFVKNAFELIYDLNPKTRKGTVRKGVLESLEGPGDPKEGLATTAVAITKRVADAAEESGVQVDSEIIQNAGAAILGELGDLQTEAGVADLSEEDLEGALYRAHDLYREILASEGKLDTAVFAQDFKAMQDADAAGRLDDVVPGATRAAERMKAIMAKGA